MLRKARFWERTARRAINDRQRDIPSLIDQVLLTKDDGGGRSTSYSLAGE